MTCETLSNTSRSIHPDLFLFMHQVPIDKCNSWYKSKNESSPAIPEYIDTKCGYCNTFVSLRFSREFTSCARTQSIISLARCPVCSKNSKVLIVDFVTWDQRLKGKKVKEIWVLPKPTERQEKIDVSLIDGQHSRRIIKLYKSIIRLYNMDEYAASVSACGRLVEAVGKTRLSGSKPVNTIGALFKKLEDEVKKNGGFTSEVIRPFLSLGEAIRLGRNPSDHFDLEIEPTQELAEKIIDLIEFFMTYIYELSGEVEKVNELLKLSHPFDEICDEVEDSKVSET